jgi:hypothetical protein
MTIINTNRNFGVHTIRGLQESRRGRSKPPAHAKQRVSVLVSRDSVRERPPISLPQLRCLCDSNDDDPDTGRAA